MNFLCTVVGTLATAFTLSCAPADAQSCNPPSGFLTQFGPISVNDLLKYGPGCGQVQDAGFTPITSAGPFVAGDMAYWLDTTGTRLGDAPFQYNKLAGASGSGQFVLTAPGGLLIDSNDATTVSSSIIFGGTITAGKTVDLTISYQNAAGVSNTVHITYLESGGDTLATVAVGMQNALIAAGAPSTQLGIDVAPFRFVFPGTVATDSVSRLRFNFVWLPGDHGTNTLCFANNSTAGSTTTINVNGTALAIGAGVCNPPLVLDTVATVGHVRESGFNRVGISGDNVWFDNYVGNNNVRTPAVFAAMTVQKVNVNAGFETGTLSLEGGQNITTAQLNLSKGQYTNNLGGGAPVLVYPGAVDAAITGCLDFGLHSTCIGGWTFSGNAVLGVWTPNPTFAVLGNSALDQSVVGNYNILMGVAGNMNLNAPTGQVVNFNINNAFMGGYSGTGIWNFLTGIQINTAAPAGHYLCGQGTFYKDCIKASVAQTVAAPTGTASLGFVMAGLAGSFTPTATGNMHLIARGGGANNAPNDGCVVQLRFGTGAAPVNGAAAAGTTSGSSIPWTPYAVNTNEPFAADGLTLGLVVGTTYWYDLAQAAVVGGTCSLSAVGLIALEQ